MSDVSALHIELRVGRVSSRLVFDGDGSPDRTEPRAERPPDLVITRSRATHEGDLTGALPAEEIAAATTVLTGSGQVLNCWGLPAVSALGFSLEAEPCLRLNLSNTPFSYRPVGVDLRIHSGHLHTGIRTGTPDLEVHADWTSAVAWLTQPRVLFADAFPGAVTISGEIALLSLYEGALWRATRDSPVAPTDALLRWSQLWPSGPARRALRAVPV